MIVEPVALVPTMGALHAGHVSLIEAAKRFTGQVVVSIFVNPAQFGPTEDFARYPRPVEQDLTACEAAGAAGVFHPGAAEMYPPQAPACAVTVPTIAEDLEGRLRPGHFAGVCRVVAKLFHIVEPQWACFGQKDLQQLRVIQAMAADLNMPIGIIECPTQRDPDGLAMSSRNQYLTAEDRTHALGLSKALREAKLVVEDAGETDPAVIERAMRMVMQAHHITVDYAVVRHPKTLAPLDAVEPALTGGVAALVAGRIGSVRLIDNMMLAVGPRQD